MTKTQALFDTWLSAKYPKWMRRQHVPTATRSASLGAGNRAGRR